MSSVKYKFSGGQTSSSRMKFILIVSGVVILAAVVLGVAIGVPLSKRSTGSSKDKAIAILESVPLVDGHNDLAWLLWTNEKDRLGGVNLAEDMRGIWPISHTDIPRLRQGRVGAQFWALYTNCSTQYIDEIRPAMEQADVIKRFINKYPDTFKFVTTAQGIEDAFAEGKIGSLIGMEGGHMISSSMGTLRMFYDLGVRYITLTHNCNTPWADNNLVDNDNSYEHEGLSDFGEKIILEMNRMGMLVDLSHVAVKTMTKALQVTKAPVIFSHTSAYALCNHSRNAPDEILEMTKENGGVVMVNFYDKFINCKPNENATLGQVADHIDYIKNIAGVDHVGIGADYDGVPTVPIGLEDVSTYPDLFAELIDRGWSDEDLKKLAGLNLIRVFKKAEEIARQLQRETEPNDEIIPNDQLPDTTCRSIVW